MPYRSKTHAERRGRTPEYPRASPSARGYGYNWQKLRTIVLAQMPLCVDCDRVGLTVPATEVDHILPLSQGGTNLLSNLQPLCKPCHSTKTGSERNG